MTVTTASPTPIDQDAARLSLLRAILAGGKDEPEGALFIRTLAPKTGATRKPGPERFVSSAEEASRAAGELAPRFDVYVGGMPRHRDGAGRISGKKACCRRGWLIWADCDSDDALDRLAEFPHRPTFLIHSGGTTAGGRPKAHAWWLVDEPLEVPEHERVLTALIECLGSDPAAKDASRVLRLPGTRHHESGQPVLCAARSGPVALAELREALPDARGGLAESLNGPAGAGSATSLTALRAAPPVGEDSGRNHWLARVAGHIANRADLTWDEVRMAILRDNRGLTHPLPDDEVEGTVLESARRWWEKAHPEPIAATRAPDATTEAQLAMLTDGWLLPSPVARVEIWGRRPNAPLDVHLADGTKLAFEEVQHTVKPEVLCQVIMASTGGRTGGPRTAKRAELLALQQILWQLAAVRTDYDARAEVTEWVQSFLTRAQVATEWGLDETAEKYAAACHLQAASFDPLSGHPPEVLVDRLTGRVVVKATDLRTFVARVMQTQIDSTRLKERMLQAGYEHRVIEAWPAGYGRDRRASDRTAKRKVAVFVLPGSEQ